MKYRSEIDGLRALAVVPVILFHAGFQAFSGGYVGVDVFFVISGYLITTILLNDLEAERFSIVHFYERRARRILPALFLVMLTCLPFAWLWLLPQDMQSFSRSLIATSTFLSNIFFWRDGGYFGTANEFKPLIHTWSLSVEEQFYLLFPLFIFFALRLGKRWILGILAVTAIGSLGIAQWGSYAKPELTFYVLPTRAWELLIGALVAFYYSAHNIKKHAYWTSELGSLLGLGLIGYAIFAYSNQTPFPSIYALAPTIGAALIIVFATNKTLVGKLLSSKPFLLIGLISYSAYLWHQPLFAFARQASEEPSGTLLATIALLTFPFAYLTWRFIERPFRNKHTFERKQIFICSIIGSIIFASIGFLGQKNGFMNRFTKNQAILLNQLLPENSKHYTVQIFDSLENMPFSSNGKKKLLIIGDSYAQDLTNAIFQAGLNSLYDISTKHIPHDCGNLFLKRDVFESNIPDTKKFLCRHPLFEDEALRQRLLQADEIWLSSAWQMWQADLIKTSVNNLQAFTQKKILVFGPKGCNLNHSLRYFLGLSDADRANELGQPKSSQVSVNRKMLQQLDQKVFINTQYLIFGESYTECHPFTDDGLLKAYDGVHLTKAGALFFGDKLLKETLQKQPN